MDSILYSCPTAEFIEQLREVIREEMRTSTPPAPGQNDQPMSVDDAAAFTGFSKSTIYQLVSTKAIPFYKKQGRLFFYSGELNDWIKGGNEAIVLELKQPNKTHKKRV